MKFKYIILIIILTIGITGCGCSKKEIVKNQNIVDITIEVPIENIETIEIKPGQNEYATIKKGKTFEIIKWITPKEKNNTSLKWKISNPEIISITDSGEVTAKKIGKTSITAYTTVENIIESNTIDIEVIE
ncbi:MAG: Ig-like domain-containing protein [Bacilli bacterium]|nr:Ig-like domain-containing protein [Bacilli bacterium]